MPLAVAPVVTLVSDIKLVVLVVLEEFMVRSLVRLAAPVSVTLIREPVLLAALAPVMATSRRLPVKVVDAPVEAISAKLPDWAVVIPVCLIFKSEPVLAPAVVIAVEDDVMLKPFPVDKRL